MVGPMDTKSKIIIGSALVLGGLGVGTGIAVAGGSSVPSSVPFVDDDRGDRFDDAHEILTDTELQQATDAALAHTGGGRVTDAERDDDGGPVRYEIEVTLDDGSEVDLDLDEAFAVLHTETDAPDGPYDD